LVSILFDGDQAELFCVRTDGVLEGCVVVGVLNVEHGLPNCGQQEAAHHTSQQ
jgi:hypothetical protein